MASPPDATPTPGGEERYRVLFEQMAVGVALLETSSGRFVRVNRSYLELLGYSEAEMLALDFMRITLREELEEDLAQMERLRAGKIREFSLEKRLLRKDGSEVWVALTVSPMWAVGELPSHHIAIVRDISERRLAQEQAHQNHEELEATLAALPDLMFDMDEDGRFHDFRAPSPELLAAPPELFLGHTMHEVLPPTVTDVIETALREALATGRSAGVRYAIVVGGEERWFELSVARRKTSAGDKRRMVAIARDVTERVEAEARRRSLEAQLRQAQKLDAIGVLAGGIAHDFNNLLTMIGLGAEGARRCLETEHPAHGSLETVEQAVGRAEQLVHQILAFSRAQPAAPEVLSVEAAIGEATGFLRAMLPAGIALVVRPTVGNLLVLADPTQLQQVLINLGTNAWQSIEGSVGTIVFEARALPAGQDPSLPPGPCVAIRVQDDGVGMSEAVQERIFEPFFTTKGRSQGSGLGLSVVHGIIEEHGGKIRLETELGRGTTFEVVLAAAKGTAAGPAVQPEIQRGEGERLVYVDDEPAIVRSICKLLEQVGYRTQGFTDPRLALETIRAEPDAHDLVITDLNMAHLSGIDLARALREIRPELPVVLVSGFAPDSSEFAEAGIRDWLAKPFDVARLSCVLAELLREGASHSSG